MKFFPAEASGGAALPVGGGGPVPQPALLPDRRHHAGQRRGLPRAAQRRLRRRVLAHPEGRSWPRGTGAASSGWPARRRRCAADRSRAWNSPRAPGRCGACDGRAAQARGLRWTAGDCGSPLPSCWRTRGGQSNRCASAQPPHTSVGYSLGGPPPFCVPQTLFRGDRVGNRNLPARTPLPGGREETTKRPARRQPKGLEATGRPPTAPPGGGFGTPRAPTQGCGPEGQTVVTTSS